MYSQDTTSAAPNQLSPREIQDRLARSSAMAAGPLRQDCNILLDVVTGSPLSQLILHVTSAPLPAESNAI